MAQRQNPKKYLFFGQISQRNTNLNLNQKYKLEFKSKIKSWKCDTYVCWLCQPFFQNLGFI